MLSQHLPAFASTAAPPFDASIVPVKPEDAIEEMNTLLAELGGLRPNISSAEFESWRLRTRSLLTRALGEHHYMTKRFVDLSWISLSFDEVADLRASATPLREPAASFPPRSLRCSRWAMTHQLPTSRASTPNVGARGTGDPQ